MKFHQLAALLFVAILALFTLSFSASPLSAPFVSSELEFTDTSRGGLEILPASCASSPHYAGECGTGGSGGTGGGTPPTVSGNACVIGLSPSAIIRGGSSILSWNSSYQVLGIPYSVAGTISPAPGAVAQSGVLSVSPTVSTTYSGTFTPTGSLTGIPEEWLTPVTCSAYITVYQGDPGPTSCSAQNFCVGADVYQQSTSCTNTLVQTCTYGCSNGVCLGAPAPTGFLRVRPALVRSGEPTTVEWSASQVSSCTTTGTNGDSWTGASGSQASSNITSQVTYTLSCVGLDSSTIERTAVVNITPIFDEQ